MKNKIIDAIGEIDNDLLESTATLRTKKRKKPNLPKWSALAACFCLAAVGAVLLFGKGGTNRIQMWDESYTVKDYFKYCDAATGSSAEMKLDASVIPYSQTRYFSDRRAELEENKIIPRIETHPLFYATAGYNDDGSFYCVEFMWCRRSADSLETYSDLKVLAGYEEIPIVNDCVFVETDENGNILEPSVTVTERDGIQIAARGREGTEKTLTYKTESGWYQISGSWNDSYDAVVSIFDWFFEHPLDFTKFPIEAGDEYTSTTLAETPDAFSGYLPDFEKLGYTEENTVLQLKNGIPVHFEGHYNRSHSDEVHWCILAEPDVYDLEACMGDIKTLTEQKLTDAFRNGENKIKFMQEDILVIVYTDSASKAWELIRTLTE